MSLQSRLEPDFLPLFLRRATAPDGDDANDGDSARAARTACSKTVARPTWVSAEHSI